ncbi:MAG: hypothetical protein QG646_1220, partial [Euryarchaeota archaeon]|nr:hypothetical protein [Euryarchaeota archaeon]
FCLNNVKLSFSKLLKRIIKKINFIEFLILFITIVREIPPYQSLSLPIS